MARQIQQENYDVHGLDQQHLSVRLTSEKKKKKKKKKTVRRWPRPTANAMT